MALKTYLLLSLAGAIAVGVSPPGGGKRDLLEFLPTPAAPLCEDGAHQAGAYVTPAQGEAILASHPEKFAWAEPLPAEEVQALAAQATLDVVRAIAAKNKVELPTPEAVILGDLQDSAPEAVEA